MSIFLAVLTWFVTALLFSTACVLLKAWWLGVIGIIASIALAYLVYKKYEDFKIMKEKERWEEEKKRREEENKRREEENKRREEENKRREESHKRWEELKNKRLLERWEEENMCRQEENMRWQEENKRREQEMIAEKAKAFLADPIAAELVERFIAGFDFSIPSNIFYCGSDEKPSVQTMVEEAEFKWYFNAEAEMIWWSRDNKDYYSSYNCSEFVFQRNGYSSQHDADKLKSLLCAVIEKVKGGYKTRYPSCEVSGSIDDLKPHKGEITVALRREVPNPNYGKKEW